MQPDRYERPVLTIELRIARALLQGDRNGVATDARLPRNDSHKCGENSLIAGKHSRATNATSSSSRWPSAPTRPAASPRRFPHSTVRAAIDALTLPSPARALNFWCSPRCGPNRSTWDAPAPRASSTSSISWSSPKMVRAPSQKLSPRPAGRPNRPSRTQ